MRSAFSKTKTIYSPLSLFLKSWLQQNSSGKFSFFDFKYADLMFFKCASIFILKIDILVKYEVDYEPV